MLATKLRPCLRTLGGPTSVRTFQQRAPPPDYGFAFDIDGVLLHGSTPLSGATRTLQYLQQKRLEFLLLTNGGGTSESRRIRQLSKLLDTPLHIQQFVQSHTPFRMHAQSRGMENVLVVGGAGDNCRAVAEQYGFQDVLIPADVLVKWPEVAPFSDPAAWEKYARPVAKGRKVDAILCFNDSRDWALDLQLIIDLLLSDSGRIGSRRPVSKVLKDGHIPLYFSNPDLWWANEYPQPRLGQGGFRAALEGLWRTITDGKGELKATTIGKPHQPTYEYAENVLTAWRMQQLGEESEHPELRRVYMVGDNPKSDIAGANGYKSPWGTEWVSILVKTGVYRNGDDDGGAKVVVNNVEEAVRWAVAREEEANENMNARGD